MAKRVCKHETAKNIAGAVMYRCACGNVWMGGRFMGSVPQDQSAASIFGAFSAGPAKGRPRFARSRSAR